MLWEAGKVAATVTGSGDPHVEAARLLKRPAVSATNP